ncbi:hypothetical protein F5148DRAFT_1159174 [Russula earlei]|uniref:Uncharacterized protein n=1 Tax=Russula earlei TaxID=71964 RepID=A0ACC0UPB8_9AGAM|nr:hypothetical protein F5148DRAFT_1159174 [Russula earlei]
MTTTTMHFGPEWMRPKHPLRPQNPPSPPTPHAPSGASSYSALLTPSLNSAQESSDSANPFLYSKDDLIKIYKEGGGRGGLGLEVERWEGVVREVGSEPVSLKEWTDGERKLFAGSINSEVRRRQSSDYLSPLATQTGERQKLSHAGSGMAAPLRERFGGLMRKRDGADQPALTIPRKLSLSSTQGPHGSTRDSSLPSPRARGPHTPSFDGILNSGETWVSRRRASESGTRLNSATIPRADGDDEPQSTSRLKIDEEEEEQHRQLGTTDIPDTLGQNPSQKSSSPSGVSPPRPERSIVGDAVSSSTNGAEDANSSTIHSATSTTNPVLAENLPLVNAASQPVTNAAGIEWSYLDPQGNVQGPFHAELMQKWYEEGYFSVDLLMRRVNLDEVWTPVGELAERAGGERIFFFNFDSSVVPPGLTRCHEHSHDPVQHQRETNGYNAPYQPVPTRSIHPSTLDSYFASSSPASNSPSSSFGAGRFGNNSPDPATFGGGHIGTSMSSADLSIGSRPGNVVDPAFVGTRRLGYADMHFEQGFNVRASLPSTGSARTPSIDSYSLNPTIPSQPPWVSSNSVHSASLSIRTNSFDHKGPSTFISNPSTGLDPAYSGESSLSRGIAAQQDPLGQTYRNVNQRDLSRLGSRDLYQLEHRAGLGIGGFDGTPSVSPFDSPVQLQPFPPSSSLNFTSPVSSQAPTTSAMSPIAPIPPPIPTTLSPSQPTWNDTPESAPKRTGLTPFDNAAFPTSRNTTVIRTVPPPSTQSWVPVKQPTPSESSQSLWVNASQGIIDDGWGHIPGPHSLTVSNLTQHTQQQESSEVFSRDGATAMDSPVESVPVQETLSPLVQSSSMSTPPEPPQHPARPSRKFSVQPAKVPTPPPSTVTAPIKPVWLTEDDKKGTGGPTSLREIQEMEVKKQEVRKAADRERARIPVTASASASEDAQTFTASWGLPTSQVGAKTSVKDTPGNIIPSASASTSTSAIISSSTQSPAPPVAVWTNTQKPSTKKSMRDILEEEERRKKVAFKESIATSAPRRAYAETTNRVTSTAPSAGAVWTTVGPNGKATAAVVAASGRPTVTPSPSVGSVASSRGTATATARSTAPPAKATPVGPKFDDTPVAPSPDFMKWLNDSLKQLNSSVNYEEIASMLLSFPLDGDATTVEIISELIYDNSTTLDGRRFAQEFITKRRADAASKKPSGRAPSIADVVKAQPKPSQQSEWGGFKVVKPKKKGGRS